MEIVIGQAGFSQAIVEIYDPLKDKWTKGLDMQVVRNTIFAGVMDGRIYVIGGWQPNVGFSKLNV